MTALWCITGLSTALACLALVLLAKVRDDLADERAACDAAESEVAAMVADWQDGFRDAWSKGYAAAEQVAAAGVEVVDLSDLDDAVTVDDVLRGWGR